MDDKLVPLMAVLTAALGLGVACVGLSIWRAWRQVAWSLVNAALTLRHRVVRFQAEVRHALGLSELDPS